MKGRGNDERKGRVLNQSRRLLKKQRGSREAVFVCICVETPQGKWKPTRFSKQYRSLFLARSKPPSLSTSHMTHGQLDSLHRGRNKVTHTHTHTQRGGGG